MEKIGSSPTVLSVKTAGRVCADGSVDGWIYRLLAANGADKVYAIDVGYGLLHWKLRQDPQVGDGTNQRAILIDCPKR